MLSNSNNHEGSPPLNNMDKKESVDYIEDVDDISTTPSDEHPDKNLHEHATFLGLSGQKLHNAISVIAGAGFLLFGYDQGVMGSLLTLPSFYKQFPSMDTVTVMSQSEKEHRSTWQGLVVAIYEIGCLIGAIATMYVGDKIGRRKTIVLGCSIMIVGAIIQTTSYSAAQLFVSRIITGIGNGFNTSTVPIWQSECAKPERRGPLVMVAGALITGGITISYWLDLGLYFVSDSSVSWRFPLAFQIAFPLVMLPFIMFLPESPRWLLMKGKHAEAARSFSALEAKPANHASVQEQIQEVQKSLELSHQGNGGRFLIFKQGKSRNFQRAMLACFVQILQQVTGQNLITYYATMVFESFLGMSPLTSRILAACNGTEYFIASWISFFTVERFGRRKLMIFSALGQAATMAVLCGTQWASTAPRHNSAASVVAAVFFFVFNTFCSIGWLGMTWLYASEITPLKIRAPVSGLSTSANWLFNFVIVMTTPVGNDQLGPFLYAVYAAINFLIAPVIYFCYPETSGRTLEEMDEIFENCNPWKPWEAVKESLKKPKLIEEKEKKHRYDV